MKLALSIGSLAGVLLLGTASDSFAQKYTVYCTNGKTEVDTRTPQQMKSARGATHMCLPPLIISLTQTSL